MGRTVDYLGITAYLEKRRKTTGGSSPPPRLPATIEDTFEAIAIADDLAALTPGTILPHPPVGDADLHHYLQQVTGRDWPGLRTTWQLLHTGKRLGLKVDDERVREYLHRGRTEGDDLYTAYYTALISTKLGVSVPPDEKPAAVPPPARLIVAEALMYLELQKISGDNQTAEPAVLIPWLQACQNGDGGFGFYPGTTSFIENCHYCLAALRLLGACPAEPERARQFIFSCQTGVGGFGRNLRAAPFLDATWHALAALRLLD